MQEEPVIETRSCIRTLRLKVKPEAYPWLNAAAIEVNQVWNFANSTSEIAARPFVGRSMEIVQRPAEQEDVGIDLGPKSDGNLQRW